MSEHIDRSFPQQDENTEQQKDEETKPSEKPPLRKHLTWNEIVNGWKDFKEKTS